MLNIELAWSFFELSALASTVTLALFSPSFTAALELFMWPDDVALPEFGPWTVPTFPRTAAGAGKAGALMLLLTWEAFGIPCFKKLSVVNTSFFYIAMWLSRSLSCSRMSTNTACFDSLPDFHTAHYYGRYTHYITSTRKKKRKKPKKHKTKRKAWEVNRLPCNHSGCHFLALIPVIKYPANRHGGC